MPRPFRVNKKPFLNNELIYHDYNKVLHNFFSQNMWCGRLIDTQVGYDCDWSIHK